MRVRQSALGVARRELETVVWNRRFLHLRGHFGFHAHPCTPATRDREDSNKIEIVLVGADSEETLHVTHSRYFAAPQLTSGF